MRVISVRVLDTGIDNDEIEENGFIPVGHKSGVSDSDLICEDEDEPAHIGELDTN